MRAPPSTGKVTETIKGLLKEKCSDRAADAAIAGKDATCIGPLAGGSTGAARGGTAVLETGALRDVRGEFVPTRTSWLILRTRVRAPEERNEDHAVRAGGRFAGTPEPALLGPAETPAAAAATQVTALLEALGGAAPPETGAA